MGKKDQNINIRVNKLTKEKIEKIIELNQEKKEIISVSDVVNNAIERYLDTEMKHTNEYELDTYSLDKRKHLDIRFNDTIQYVSDDTLDIENDIRELKKKYRNNRSKYNILSVLQFTLKTLNSLKKYERTTKEYYKSDYKKGL